MRATYSIAGRLTAVLFVVLLAAPGLTAPVPVDDEQALRQKALKLNEVTGDDPILTGKIALAHMKEFPDYYERLERMERAAQVWVNGETLGDASPYKHLYETYD